MQYGRLQLHKEVCFRKHAKRTIDAWVGHLTCLGMKLLRIRRDILQKLPKKSCLKIQGHGDFYSQTFNDTNGQEFTNERTHFARGILQSVTHLVALKMPRFLEFLEVKLRNSIDEKNGIKENVSLMNSVVDSKFNDFDYVLANRHTYLPANTSTSNWTNRCPGKVDSAKETVWVCKTT